MSKRSQAIAIFNAELSTLPKLGATAFRAKIIKEVMTKTDTSHAGAAAMYNNAKRLAQEAGKVEKFGRKLTDEEAEARYIARIDAQEAREAEEEFELLEYAVVNDKGQLIDTFASKSTAYRARDKEAGEKVMLTADVTAE